MSPELTILLPYFNERGWLGKTIASLAAQTDTRFSLLLIDNGSTDGSGAEAREYAAALGNRVTHLVVPEPGKTQALAAAQQYVRTPLLATCDADTIYPPEYIANVLALFRANPEVSCVMALDLYEPATSAASQRRISKLMRRSVRRPNHCHAGAYAQAFRSPAFFAAGGFDPVRWPFLMEDHEIVQRLLNYGPAQYAAHHVCYPSDRRKNRSRAHWNRFERLIYRLVPSERLNWYFQRFLGPRLAARRSLAPALRVRDWNPQKLSRGQ
jgi:glycosyltransferase involved in cell wall biosynthesis